MSSRPMRMWLRRLEEPKLLFGGGHEHHDPKHALTQWGPFSFESGLQKVIKLGLVAAESEIEPIQKWFDRLNGPLIDSVTNVLKFPNFPGLARTYRCKFEFPEAFIRVLPTRELGFALAQGDHDRFDALLSLYSDAIGTLFGDVRPDVVIVGFPEEVAELRIRNKRINDAEHRTLKARQKEEDNAQLSFFDSFAEKEVTAAAELFPHSEELLFRIFHRALKAKCMVMRNAVPLQIVRQHTYLPPRGRRTTPHEPSTSLPRSTTKPQTFRGSLPIWKAERASSAFLFTTSSGNKGRYFSQASRRHFRPTRSPSRCKANRYLIIRCGINSPTSKLLKQNG